MTTSTRSRLAGGGRDRLAALAAALLTACAGAQVPAGAAPTAREATPDAGAVTEAAPAGAPEVTGAAPAADGAAAAPAKPRLAPEVAQRARTAFEEGAKLEAAGDLAGAASAFERAAAANPDLAWAGLNAGLLHERRGDDRGAVAAYEKVLEARPEFAPAAQNLARLWIRQGKADEGERELRARLAKADGVALRVGLAELLLAAGNLDGAEAECRAALKADEKNLGAMVVLATTYSRKKRFELSRMVLENARQVDPADPAVWNRLGFVEMELGNRVQAIEHFRTAAALRPDYPEAHANYGALLADADDFAGAVRELELAVKYGPGSARAWLNLGNAYRGLQQFEKSEQAYRKAVELDPGLNDVNFNLAVLYLDVERPGLPTLQRLEQGVGYFDAYEAKGGVEPRVAAYRKDAAREIDREKKRLAREEKDRARKEAEAKRKAEEDAKVAAEAEALRQAEEAKRAEEARAAEVKQAEEARAKAAAANQPPAAAPGQAPAEPAPQAPAPEAAPAAPAPAPASEAAPAGPAPQAPAPAPEAAPAAPAGDTTTAPPAAPAPGKLGEERGDK